MAKFMQNMRTKVDVMGEHFRNLTPEQVYLEWTNNWLTLQKMADWYCVDIDELNHVIDKGRIENNNRLTDEG